MLDLFHGRQTGRSAVFPKPSTWYHAKFKAAHKNHRVRRPWAGGCGHCEGRWRAGLGLHRRRSGFCSSEYPSRRVDSRSHPAIRCNASLRCRHRRCRRPAVIRRNGLGGWRRARHTCSPVRRDRQRCEDWSRHRRDGRGHHQSRNGNRALCHHQHWRHR